MRRNRLFGWMTGLTSAALAAMAAAAPVMAAVSENSPGGGNSGNGERVEETVEDGEAALREGPGVEEEDAGEHGADALNAPAVQSGETESAAAGVYEFQDTKTAGTVTVVKKWDDQSTNAERPRADVSISTQKPSKNPLGYTVTFHADAEKGLTFADGSTENEVVYNSSGQIISGAYKGLAGGSGVVRWYTDRTYQIRVELDKNGILATQLTGDIDAWPKEVTFEVEGYKYYGGVTSQNGFNRAILDTVASVVFTDEAVPADTALIDVDADGDGGVVAWTEGNGTIMKVSTQIKGVKVQAAQNSSRMFSNKSKIQTIDFTNLDTTNVTNMSYMFYGCSSLTSLDVSAFNTAKAKEMGGMFHSCSKLTSLDVSKFDTAKVASIGSMFEDCSGLTNLDVSSFDTSNVTYMGRMFKGCSRLTSLDVSSFDTANVTNMSAMFAGCSGLASLDVSVFNTAKVVNMDSMFKGCSKLTSLDVSSFDTVKVSLMNSIFEGCSGLASLDVSSFNTTNVTYMLSMFKDCSGLTNLNLSSFDTVKVTRMDSMFKGCSKLTNLNLSSFNTSNVTDMGSMFSGCNALTTLTTGFNFKFTGRQYSLSGTWRNTAGETFTSGNFPSNVADTYTRIAN